MTLPIHQNAISINWEQRGKNCPVHATRNPRIMRIAAVALGALAVAFTKIAASLAATKALTGIVMIGAATGAAGLAVVTGLAALYLLFGRTYYTSNTLATIEKGFVDGITSKKWVEILEQLAAFKLQHHSTLGDTDYSLNCILGAIINKNTAVAFLGENDLAGFTAHQKEILRRKLIAEAPKDLEQREEFCSRNKAIIDALNAEFLIWNPICVQILNQCQVRGCAKLNQAESGVISRHLNLLQKQLLVSIFVKENLSKERNDIKEALKKAGALGIKDEVEMFLRSVMVNESSLEMNLGRFGVDVLQYLPKQKTAREKLVGGYVSGYTFANTTNTLHVLFERGLVDEKDADKLRERFYAYVQEKHLTWRDVQHTSIIRDLNIDKSAFVSRIQKYEVSLGYGRFVARNGSDSFEYLDEASKNNLRASYIRIMRISNAFYPDQRFIVPDNGEKLGITQDLVDRAREEWFKLEAEQGFAVFLKRNTFNILRRLNADEQAVLRSLFMAEPITNLWDCRLHREVAGALNVGAEFDKKLVDWVREHRTQKTLREQISYFGIEFIHPLFLDNNADKELIEAFVNECDLETDKYLLQELRYSGYLAVVRSDILPKKIAQKANDENLGWLEAKQYAKQFEEIFTLRIGDVMPLIEKKECANGYEVFVERNGTEALNHLSHDVGYNLFETYLGSEVMKEGLHNYRLIDRAEEERASRAKNKAPTANSPESPVALVQVVCVFEKGKYDNRNVTTFEVEV
jgi:hypothetical protein